MLFDRFRRPGASTEARSTPLFLGVEFKGAEVHLARYERRDDRVFLLHEATRSIADKSVDEQAEVLRDAVAELRLPRFGQRIAVTSVGDDVAILRAVKMTVGQGSKRERAARYQAANAQKFNAWKLDDCIVKAAAVAGRDDVFLVAKALREPVRERVALLKRAGLTAWIQHRSFTLGRALPNAPAILDVGRTSSALYVYSTMVKGELEPLPVPISVNVAFGEIDITRAIMSARNVTIMEAEADMDAGLDESAMQEIDNLGSMLAGHVAQLRDEYSAEIGEIVLVGRLGRFEGVERHLSRHLVLPVSVASLDGLESEDYPREIVRARGADLAPTLGAALLYDEPDRARRLNFAGTDFEAFASLTLEDRKLRRALVAPLLAVAVVASAYVIEGVRDGDMAAQAAQAQADLKLARAEEQRVTGLSDNVKELVAVYNDLQAIRNSGADRARELFEIDSKLTALDVSSIKATTDGWTITGNARDHSDVGRVLQAVQTALPGIVAVIPSDAIRPEVHPNDPVAYTFMLTRAAHVTAVAPATSLPTGPGPSPSPAAPSMLFALGALEVGRRRSTWDRRSLNLAAFLVAGLGYIVIVYNGEAEYAKQLAVRDSATAQTQDALSAIHLRNSLLKTQQQLVGNISNLTPQKDVTSLVSSAYQELDAIARSHATISKADTHVSGAVLDDIKLNLTERQDAGRQRAAVAASQGRINAKGEVAPSPLDTPPPELVLDTTSYRTGGAADLYAKVVPATVIFEGSLRDALACVSDISRSKILAQVKSASLTRVGDRSSNHVTVSLDIGFYMPLVVGMNGKLVPSSPVATPHTMGANRVTVGGASQAAAAAAAAASGGVAPAAPATAPSPTSTGGGS